MDTHNQNQEHEQPRTDDEERMEQSAADDEPTAEGCTCDESTADENGDFPALAE